MCVRLARPPTPARPANAASSIFYYYKKYHGKQPASAAGSLPTGAECEEFCRTLPIRSGWGWCYLRMADISQARWDDSTSAGLACDDLAADTAKAACRTMVGFSRVQYVRPSSTARPKMEHV